MSMYQNTKNKLVRSAKLQVIKMLDANQFCNDVNENEPMKDK